MSKEGSMPFRMCLLELRHEDPRPCGGVVARPLARARGRRRRHAGCRRRAHAHTLVRAAHTGGQQDARHDPAACTTAWPGLAFKAVSIERASNEFASLEALSDRLQAGLEFNAAQGDGASFTPEDNLAARQTALACTQAMLMTLDREHRLVFVLALLFGLPSKKGAAVTGLSDAAYRQRLSSARARLDAFAQRTCGLANADAACRCEKQLPALRHLQRGGAASAPSVIAIHPIEQAEVLRALDGLVRISDAASALRAHPEYRAPEALRGAIRAVLRSEGYGEGAARH
jgi:DNA-directed RNA polymerase specialized sigma24 family protein